MKKKEWFIVKDLEGFINTSRRLVFNSFGSKENDESSDITSTLDEFDEKELDNVLSYDEALSIAKMFMKKQKHKLTAEVRYIIDEQLYMSIITAFNDRLVSNILNSLVNKGLIDTAFDEESNDFVFWIKDEHKKNISENFQQPETD